MEARVEKNGLSVCIDGRPCAGSLTAAIVWRRAGDERWTTERATELRAEGERFYFLFKSFELTLTLAESGAKYIVFEPVLTHTGSTAVDLARINCLEGMLPDTDAALIAHASYGSNGRIYRRGDAVASLLSECDSQNERFGCITRILDDPYHGEENWATAVDVGVIRNGGAEDGLTVGFYGEDFAFGEIGMKTQTEGDILFYAAMLLDNILFEPGESIRLDKLMIRNGHWIRGLAFWSERCAENHAPRIPVKRYVGYCSWYQKYNYVTMDDVTAATEQFRNLPVTSDSEVIVQLDDGYQIMPGEWEPNETFAGLKDIPAKITDNGQIPGIWLAPSIVMDECEFYQNDNSVIQRLPDGSPAIAFCNWDHAKKGGNRRASYVLDIDNPKCRDFMTGIVKKAVADGWKYLKIDFMPYLSTARVAYDRKKTSLRSLKETFAAFREAAGDDIILCACIGSSARYAIGYADTARIGGDVSGDFKTMRTILKNGVVGAIVCGQWWQPDLDVFFMRTENNGLTAEENWMLTGTIGLIGGVFMTSDLVSQWEPEAKERIAYFWNGAGSGTAADIEVQFDDDYEIQWLAAKRGERTHIGLYNWSGETRDISIRYHGTEFIAEAMPPHSLRIIETGETA